MRFKYFWLALWLPLAAADEARVPTQRDFAYGMRVAVPAGSPLVEMELPDAVYAGVLNDNLSDLRVFEQGGGIVPHTLCPAPAPKAVEPRLEDLPVFPLRAGQSLRAGEGARIEVKTASGTELSVTEPGAAAPADADRLSAYVLDLRALKQPVTALRFDWSTSDAASETSLRIQASEDLEQWRTLMQSATLLRAQAGGQQLQRARIPLPETKFAFLRVEPAGDAPLPQINGVTAELRTASEAAVPAWVPAMTVSADKTEEGTAFWFDVQRLAPMHTAEVRLPAQNMALVIRLQSRADHEQSWRERWQGEVFALASMEEAAQGPRQYSLVHFAPTTDRYWQVKVLRGAETLHGMQPALQLGYQPARLRFLAQGEPPYLVAYGSARVEDRAAAACEQLLASLPREVRERVTGQAQIESSNVLNNPAALRPLPKPTPVRQMVLWGVLVAGALLVLAMAATLIKKLRQE